MMNHSRNSQYILIDIDCLYDTRLSALSEISEEIATAFITNGYHKRISDQFSKLDARVDDKLYAETYAKRDAYTLSRSALTAFALDLYKIIDNIIVGRSSNPEAVGDIKIYLNIHPYKLDESEILDLKICMAESLPEYVPIEVVSLPLHEITTHYLHYKEIAAYFTYNLDAWLIATLKDKTVDDVRPIPSVGIFPAMLTFSHETMLNVVKENRNPQGEEANPFETVTLALSGLFAVEWMPSHVYSLAELAKINGDYFEPTFK